jgi:hypothetical protein
VEVAEPEVDAVDGPVREAPGGREGQLLLLRVGEEGGDLLLGVVGEQRLAGHVPRHAHARLAGQLVTLLGFLLRRLRRGLVRLRLLPRHVGLHRADRRADDAGRERRDQQGPRDRDRPASLAPLGTADALQLGGAGAVLGGGAEAGDLAGVGRAVLALGGEAALAQRHQPRVGPAGVEPGEAVVDLPAGGEGARLLVGNFVAEGVPVGAQRGHGREVGGGHVAAGGGPGRNGGVGHRSPWGRQTD